MLGYGFCFIFPNCNTLSTSIRRNLFQCLHKTRSFSLKENEAGFLETENLIFSIVAVFYLVFVLD